MSDRHTRYLLRYLGTSNQNLSVRVLICDDEPPMVEKITAILKHTPRVSPSSIKIFPLSDPARLTDELLLQMDILFLDIHMGAYNGMAVARWLRALHSNALLIFVTNHAQFSLEGYEVQAFRYVLKTEMETRLPQYFREALAQLYPRAHNLDFTFNGEPYHVNTDDILYFESHQRVLYLHLRGGGRSSPPPAFMQA